MTPTWDMRLGDCLCPTTGMASLGRRLAAKCIPEPNTGCMLWMGSVNAKGYGHIGLGRRIEKAHRAAWLITHGSIPAGAQVLHRCDTPACVNPDHLFLGTNLDNVADKVAKGRQGTARGEDVPNAKLTRAQVDDMRRRAAAGEPSSSLSSRFDVCVSTVCRIVRRKLWT